MTQIVLDANVALDWHLRSVEGDAYSLPLWKRGVAGQVRYIVPEHFAAEVARIIVMRGLKGRAPLGAKWMHLTLQSLDLEPIDTFVMGLNFELLGKLAETYGLDAPDIPYFHFARENGIPIATRDAAIIRACKTWNVEHWHP